MRSGLFLYLFFTKPWGKIFPSVFLRKTDFKFENHPDPGALAIPSKYGGGYIVASTSNYEKSTKTGPAFPLLWSNDLVTWILVNTD